MTAAVIADTRTKLIAERWLAEDPAAAGLLLLEPVEMTGHSREHDCSAHGAHGLTGAYGQQG